MRHMAQPFHINDFHAAAGKAGNDGFLFEVLVARASVARWTPNTEASCSCVMPRGNSSEPRSRLREMRKRLKRVTKSSMSMSVRYVWW